MCNFSVKGCFGCKYQNNTSQADVNGRDMDWLLYNLQVKGWGWLNGVAQAPWLCSSQLCACTCMYEPCLQANFSMLAAHILGPLIEAYKSLEASFPRSY